VIADKLEFLEVTRAGLSKLQLLLVQLEVNLSKSRTIVFTLFSADVG